MIIKNIDELNKTELRGKTLEIIEAGIQRVLPSTIMLKSIKFDKDKKILSIEDKEYDLSKGRVFVIGGGKASGLMAETLEKITGPEIIVKGIVNCKSTDYKTDKTEILLASHPTPCEKGVAGIKRMLGLKAEYSIDENDVVLCLISGGGSALMPCPADGITLEDKQNITKLLLNSGAEIHEINSVRKHLSKIKGGQLGRYFSPAKVVSLILSDVIGNDLDVIASGPSVPDSSTFEDAYGILKKYDLVEKAPENVTSLIKKGLAGEIDDTPKKLDNCENFIIGDNKLALDAMADKAKELGFNPIIITSEQKGEPTEVAKQRADEILNNKYSGHDLILIGGETTPKLPENSGKGGRNQHYAAVSMTLFKDCPKDWVIASVGTDGSDFLEDVAGAIVDKDSLKTAEEKELKVKDYLERYDSFNLLEKIGNSLILTGNTGTNVCDVIVYVIK
ncbi:DUF4147 domain-containing protein [Candidatus Pacearchaeota archaeon]|nr:DUF4147 domain-containing protein [Candidatus Pacearchaeota archaeon]